MDSTLWKNRLREIRSQHRNWVVDNRIAEGEDVEALQQILWYGWPILMIVAAGVAVFSVRGMLRLSKSAVLDYVKYVNHRRSLYLKYDRHRESASTIMDVKMDQQQSL